MKTTKFAGLRRFSAALLLGGAVLAGVPAAAFAQTTLPPVTEIQLDPFWVVTSPDQAANATFVAIGMEVQEQQGVTAAEADQMLINTYDFLAYQYEGLGGTVSAEQLANALGVPVPTTQQVAHVRAELQAAGSNVA